MFWVMVGLLSIHTPSSLAGSKKNGFALDDALVPVREIKSGGPPKNGIPALHMPKTVAPAGANYLNDTDRVLGISLNDRARAYPVRILNHHEIVNDIIAGEVIAVTYCPLCGSGVAFNAQVGQRVFEFGVSGLLYNSDVLMYDLQTESLWSQIMQSAISGEMRGTKLEMLPLTHTSWKDWRSRHPHTDVLSDDTGYRRDYTTDPYARYESTSRLMFPVRERDRRYPRKSLVLGLQINGRFKAYPFAELQKGPTTFVDSIDATQVEIVYDQENRTASARTLKGSLLPSMIAYWFAWYAFHPETEVYTVP